MSEKKVLSKEISNNIQLLQPRDVVKTRLQERIEKGLMLKHQQVDTKDSYEALLHEFRKWDTLNFELLQRIFTTNRLADEYNELVVNVQSLNERTLAEKIFANSKSIENKIRRIDLIIERLELIPMSPDHMKYDTAQSDKTIRSNKVFVVHGRDEIAKTSLEVFLHEIGLEPIVLHRQADEGMTIIEKFEKHSDVAYAFILLTPDEIGYLASEDSKPDDARYKEYRARPNVIFEFGYFVGKLGRSKVCCLYTGNVTLPSDVNGIIYKRYEKNIEEVAYNIIKDLKASGYEIA